MVEMKGQKRKIIQKTMCKSLSPSFSFRKNHSLQMYLFLITWISYILIYGKLWVNLCWYLSLLNSTQITACICEFNIFVPSFITNQLFLKTVIVSFNKWIKLGEKVIVNKKSTRIDALGAFLMTRGVSRTVHYELWMSLKSSTAMFNCLKTATCPHISFSAIL